VPININNQAFGARVRGWRDRLGLSQEKLAELAGLHRTYISDVERGARNLSLNSINKLAGALKVSAATLLLETGQVLPGHLIDILLVEDDPQDVELTLASLRKANILNRIHVEADGLAALNYLAGGDVAPVRLPHLILLDLGLPKMDGVEVLRRIKADSRTSAIPLVVLTGSNRDKDIATCKRLGAGGYIVKPVELQNLCAVTPQLSLHWALLSGAPG
jgi:CheY-like chemotaxis protein/DNA-binding XRE family transcriptional regulator